MNPLRSIRAFAASVLVVLALAISAAPAVAEVAPAPRSPWFPLEAGNEWRFREAATGATLTMRCEVQAGAWARVSGLFGTSWLGYDPAWGEVVWIYGAAGARPFIRVDAPSWDLDLTPRAGDTYRAAWGGRAGVTTPAGWFWGARELRLAPLPEPGTPTAVLAEACSFWLAEGVGPVRIVTARRTLNLVEARIGGRRYAPPEPRITVPSPVTGAAGELVWFRVDARDAGRRPIPARFATSPAYLWTRLWINDHGQRGSIVTFRPTAADVGTHEWTLAAGAAPGGVTATVRVVIAPAQPWGAGLAPGRIRLAGDLSVLCLEKKTNNAGFIMSQAEVRAPLRITLAGTNPGGLKLRIQDPDRTYPIETFAAVAADGTFWFSGDWHDDRLGWSYYNSISGAGRILSGGRVVLEHFGKSWQNGQHYLLAYAGDRQPQYHLGLTALEPDTRATLAPEPWKPAGSETWER